MTRFLFKTIISVLISLISTSGQCQKYDTTCFGGCQSNGYFVFIKMNSFEQTVFLPCDSATKKYSFKQLEKLKGRLLKGQESYIMYKAQKSANKYNVFVPRTDENGKAYQTKVILGILPVNIKYKEYPPGQLKRDTGIPFDYKGKRYVINYIDDWDASIEEIKYLK